MNIQAKLVQLLPIQKGMGKNGQWRKQDIIVLRKATPLCFYGWINNTLVATL